MKNICGLVIMALTVTAPAWGQVATSAGGQVSIPASAPNGPDTIEADQSTAAMAKAPSCDQVHLGSTWTQATSAYTHSICAGQSCSGQDLSLRYLSYGMQLHTIYTCVFAGGYAWKPLCKYGSTTWRGCVPQVVPCPKCKPTDVQSYSTRPTWWTTQQTFDTCHQPGAGMTSYDMAQVETNQANDAAAAAASVSAHDAVLAARSIAVQPVCVAVPD